MYKQYVHHGKTVWVRDDLQGTHRQHCLCFACTKLNINDRKENCKIANELYKLCVKHNLTTPVFECPEFESKVTLTKCQKFLWSIKMFFINLRRWWSK